MLLVGTETGVVALEEAEGRWRVAWRALEGQAVAALAFRRGQPSHLLAATYSGGVFRSEDGGRSWRQVLGRDAWAVGVAPDGRAYAGLKPAAVARSADGGATWEDLTERLRRLPTYDTWDAPFPPYTAHVRTLAFAPGSPAVVYGGVEVGGVIRSRDGGDTWEEVRNGVHPDVHTLVVAPADPATLYAATGGGFYRSFDEGASWEGAQRGMRHRYTRAVAVHPAEPRTVLTATLKGPPGSWRGPSGADATLYRSRDGGDTWEALGGGLPQPMVGGLEALAVDPQRPERVVAGLSTGEVWASADGGDTWQAVATGVGGVNSFAFA